MKRSVIAVLLAGALALSVAGDAPVHALPDAENNLVVSIQEPRASAIGQEWAALQQSLVDQTHNAWSIKIYPQGVNGDDRHRIKLVRTGCAFSTTIQLDSLSGIVPEAALLSAPGVIQSHDQLGAVVNDFLPRWARSLKEAGIRVIAWGDNGSIRWFARSGVKRPFRFDTSRVWRGDQRKPHHQEPSAVKDWIPFGTAEMFGVLKSGMVDMVMTSTTRVVDLSWFDTLRQVTSETFGPIATAMVVNDAQWQTLPAQVRSILEERAAAALKANRRKGWDDQGYKDLLKRGVVASPLTAAELDALHEQDRELLAREVGKLYSSEALEKARGLVEAYGGPD